MKNEFEKNRSLEVPVLLESMYLVNAQLNRIVKGIQTMAAKRKMTVRMTTSFEELADWCASGKLNVAIILCYSKVDAEKLVRRFYEAKIHPIFVNMQLNESFYPYSCVVHDYRMSCYHLVKELAVCGVKKLAYLGNNKDSFTDTLRYHGLMLAAHEDKLSCDVFDNDGDLDECIEKYLPHINNYDATVCVNDIVAVLLAQRLDNPENCRIAGFGGMTISKETGGFTTVVVDNLESGMNAVEIYVLMSKRDIIGNIMMTLSSKIVFGTGFQVKENATASCEHVPSKHGEDRIDFYDNANVLTVTGLENLLLNCDDVDRSILKNLLTHAHYSEIEDRSFMSINAIKYRINKMIKNAGVHDKGELMELVQRFGIKFE